MPDSEDSFLPYRPPRLSADSAVQKAAEFYEQMRQRRSVREFSSDPVPRELIEFAIRTASSAPSGANRQPWQFVAVEDPALKREIRIAAEREERESYERRMSQEWLDALRPFGTTWQKPFLEIVPWLVVVFEQPYELNADGQRRKNYYVKESVGIACGIFIAALHQMGLATLTHTPSPMTFLSRILNRPSHERPYLLFPIGYPAADARVPKLRRKTLDEVSQWPR